MKLPAFKLLSPEQDKILNLPLEGSYVVMGPPGSGKTVIALYRAQMLYQRGERSVLLVYNNPLKKYLAAATSELKIGARTTGYFEWLKSTFMEYYHVQPPMLSTFKHDWAAILSRVNTSPPPGGALPFLIVDEGQDLHPMFYQLARYLSKNLTVLADGNQVLYDDNASLNEIRANARITHPPQLLTKNYRNSREIAELAARFHSGIETGIPDLPTRSGPPVVLRSHVETVQSVHHIGLYRQQNPKTEVGVFLPSNPLAKRYTALLERKLGAANVQHYYKDCVAGKSVLRDNLDFSKPAVRVTNYWLAKGLEFDAVFLPEMQKYDDDPTSGKTRMLFYVLLSRARENLFMYYIKKETPLIQEIMGHLAELGQGGDDSFDTPSNNGTPRRQAAALRSALRGLRERP